MAVDYKVRVLFVCMGNICRSPTAEAVMRHLVSKRGLEHSIYIDSAGTHDYHIGRRSDDRTRQAGERRGYKFDHLARQVKTVDFTEFDYIIAMDRENMRLLRQIVPPAATAQLSMMMSHCDKPECEEVPDPYYGGARGFEHVLDLLENSCSHLLDEICREHQLC